MKPALRKFWLKVVLFVSLSGFGAAAEELGAILREKAEQGNATAQNNLGVMYDNGEGVPKDFVQAHVWFSLAGANGNEDAKKNLAIIEKDMTAEPKTEAMKLARELFAKQSKKN